MDYDFIWFLDMEMEDTPAIFLGGSWNWGITSRHHGRFNKHDLILENLRVPPF